MDLDLIQQMLTRDWEAGSLAENSKIGKEARLASRSCFGGTSAAGIVPDRIKSPGNVQRIQGMDSRVYSASSLGNFTIRDQGRKGELGDSQRMTEACANVMIEYATNHGMGMWFMKPKLKEEKSHGKQTCHAEGFKMETLKRVSLGDY